MTVVLSYHGNRESEVALEEALALARCMKASVTVVLAQKAGSDDPRTEEDAEELLWAHLSRTDMPFEIHHAPHNQAVADAVLDVAKQTNAEFIVLGLRPGGSGSTTIGPNASRILLDAPCSVVTTTTRD